MVRRTAHGGPNPSGEKGKNPSGDAVPAPRLAATGPTPLRTPPHGRRRQTRGRSHKHINRKQRLRRVFFLCALAGAAEDPRPTCS